MLLTRLHGRALSAAGVLAGLMRFDDATEWRLRADFVAGLSPGC